MQNLAAVPTTRIEDDLDEIVSKLSAGKQRATCLAVADVLGVSWKTVVNNLPRTYKGSWVVAFDTGLPTRYDEQSIDPDCLQQIRAGERHIISEASTLQRWIDLF